MNTSKYHAVERAAKSIIIMLMVEFVLGVLLTTVIDFDPSKHSVMQSVVLVAHILVGVGLLIGSFIHILTARSSRLLGLRPVIGFLFIAGAFASGSAAVRDGSSLMVCIMALCFGAAIVNYGLSYVAIRTASQKN